MTTYEAIDTLCDSVSPILLLIASGLLFKQVLGRARARAQAGFAFLSAGLGLVYGLMFLDQAFGLWATFGADYSTHTAFALVVSLSIILSSNKKLLVLAVFTAYMALMRYQQYHSLLDMGTTIIAVGVPLMWCARYVHGLATTGQADSARARG